MGELVASRQPPVLDVVPWLAELERINHEGEEDHFEFFKSVFAGTHEVFAGQPYPWVLATSDSAYPAYSLPSNPTAYVGHPGQIEAPGVLKLAWLGNMQYWIVLSLLDHGCRYDTPVALDLAKMHMIGPMLSLIRHMPKQGCGMPFDQLSTGYDPGRTSRTNLEYIVRFLHRSNRLARELASSCLRTIRSISTHSRSTIIPAWVIGSSRMIERRGSPYRFLGGRYMSTKPSLTSDAGSTRRRRESARGAD